MFARYVLPEIEVLCRVARSLTSQPADAEDLVQDTLLRAFRAIDGFDGRHPRAWLLTILRNAEHDRHRRPQPCLLTDPYEVARLAGAAPGDAGRSPEELLDDSVFDVAITRAVTALPDKQRRVLALVDMRGLSYAEAAAVLGVPLGTVMSRLHRARDRIRSTLAEDEVTVSHSG